MLDGILGGLDVVVSLHLRPLVCVQFRRPRSRSRRIRKKWSRRPQNWTWRRAAGPDMVRVGRTVYATPEAYQAIQRAMGVGRAA